MVVGVFNPENNLGSAFLTGPATASIQYVFCSEAKNSSIAALSPAEATRPIGPVNSFAVSTPEMPIKKLTRTIRMNNYCAGRFTIRDRCP